MKKILFALIPAILLGCSEAPEKSTSETTKGQAPQEVVETKTQAQMAQKDKARPAPNVSEQTKMSSEDQNKIVAKVNGKPILQKDLKGRPVRDVVNHEIIYQEGLSQGLDQDPAITELIEEYKKGLVTRAMTNKIIEESGALTASEQEISALYNEKIDNYTRLYVEQIITGSKAIAEEYQQRAAAGESFEDVSKYFETKKIKLAVAQTKIPRSLNKHFPNKKKGQVSPAVKDGPNYKVMRVLKVQQIPLRSVSKSLEAEIMAHKRPKVIAEYANKTVQEKGIKVEIMP